ncbi:MAG: hypothetical protein AAGC68_04535, partial [Verrucomicrobiota bacterium]
MKVYSLLARFGTVLFVLSFAPAMLDLDRVDASVEKYEKVLLRLHNNERKKRNRPKLRRSAPIVAAAKNYATVMEANSHFSHTGL